jgi:glycine/D-amino acid oxidase-like deaminating enzyme
LLLAGPGLVLKGLGIIRELRSRRVPVRYRTELRSIEQSADGLRAVFDGPGGAHDVIVDVLCMNDGFEPQNEILRLLGADMRYDPVFGHLRCERSALMETTVPGLFAVGDCAGLGGAPAASAEGRIGGAAAAAACGHGDAHDLFADRRALARHRRFQRLLWSLHAPAPRPLAAPDDTIVCRCEEVTLGDLRSAMGDDAGHVGTVKRATRLGMGRCQGRYCGPVAVRLLAESRQTEIEPTGAFSPRAFRSSLSRSRPSWPHKRRWMPPADRCDLLIIGGGIVGLTAALSAADRGARVMLVDAGVNAGSTANAGSLHVQLQSRFIRLFPEQAPNVEASLPLYLQAVEEWDRLEAAHGPFEMRREGGLMLAEGADQMRFLEAKAGREAAKGLSVELLDRAALDRIAPWIGPQIVGAELCRNEGKLNPLIANIRLRAEAARRGVAFATDRILRLSADGAAQGQRARYRGSKVILATAWGTGELTGSLGLALPSRAEALHMNITEPGEVRIDHLIQHAERPITLKQFASGQIVIGGGWPAKSCGEHAVPAVLAESMLPNVALAARLVPAIGGLRVLRTWAGMNTTVDGKTVLGPVPGAGRILLAVPGDAGYTLGPLVGRAAAELALGLTPCSDVAPYSPARFSA